jgi:hypothetical protein
MLLTGAGGDQSGASGVNGADGGVAVTTGTGGTTTTGVAGSTGGAGTTGAAGGAAGAPGSAGAGAGCTVTIVPLDPPSFFSLVAGPSSTLEMQASVSGYTGTPTWQWSVEMTTGTASTPVPVTLADDTGARVEVPLPTPGKLAIRALIAGAPQCNREPSVYQINAPQTPTFVFRVTPPSGSMLPVSESVLAATDLGGGPHTLDLGGGSVDDVVSLAPIDARGFPLPSFIRVTSPSFNFDLEGYTSQSPLITPLDPALTYDVLVVPEAGLAPLLVSGQVGDFQKALGPTVAPGLPVMGVALDGAGTPVVGAHVLLLRDGALPSTVGVTAADGTFELSARDGMLSAEIVPPDGSGLPTAHVAPGIVLLAEETNLSLTMAWAASTSGDLSATVRDPGGTLVQGARVRADATGDLSSVGMLTVAAPGVLADAHLTATGSAEADAITDAQGLAHLGRLPTGSYHITAAPPAGMSAAVTMSDVTLPAAGLAAAVPLAALVAVTGTLTPLGPTAGASVTALDQGVLASSTLPTAVAAADGTYTLMLSPGRSYELLVQPAQGQALGAGVLSVVTPGTSAGARSDVVPAGLTWSGVVTGAGRPVAGALVEVFCGKAGASCVDASIAVAQGMTRADGTLSLLLPSLSNP